jgi:hypothetical protein
MKRRGILIIYLVICLVLLPTVRHDIGPDAISYISIARSYLNFNFHDALNAYWSPFISWVLVPFIGIGLDPLLSFKIITILFGLLSLNTTISILNESGLTLNPDWIKRIIECALIPLFCFFAGMLSPDIISLFFLLKYLQFLIKYGKDPTRSNLLKIVLIAFAAYLTKSYNLIFVFLHFTFVYFILWKRHKKGIGPYILTISLLILFCSCWFVPISFKYKKLTLSTAGEYNFSIIGPTSNWHPTLNKGLLPPPYKNAISAWEDPSYIPLNKWSPVANTGNFFFYLKHILKQMGRFGKYFFFYPTFLLTLVYVLYRFIQKKIKPRLIEGFLLSFFLYPIVYFFIFTEERYVWVIHLILLIFSGYFLSSLLRNNFLRKFRIPLICFFVAGIIYFPVRMLAIGYYYSNKQAETEAQVRKMSGIDKKAIASEHGLWQDGLYLSYYKNDSYFGSLPSGLKDFSVIQKELKKNNIDLYLAHKGNYFESNELYLMNTYQGELILYNRDASR